MYYITQPKEVNSVFKTKYTDGGRSSDVLEQHVRLTEEQADGGSEPKKQICHKFKKGS